MNKEASWAAVHGVKKKIVRHVLATKQQRQVILETYFFRDIFSDT